MRAYSRNRFFVAKCLMTLPFILLVGRLYYLQIIRGDVYLQRSESNFIQERPIPHHRGLILDQRERPLVDNRPSHDVYVTFGLLPDSQKTVKKLAKYIGLSKVEIGQLAELLESHQTSRLNAAVAVPRNIDPNDCSDLTDFIDANQIKGVHLKYTDRDTSGPCQVLLDPAEFPSQLLAYRKIQELLAFADGDMKQHWEAAKKRAEGQGQFKSVLLLADVGFETYARVENAASLGLVPGIAVFDSVKRRHVYGSLASHALGYVNEASMWDIERSEGGYRSGDRLGRRGTEAVYEHALRGQDGVERLVVDAKGRRFDEVREEALLGDDRVVPPLPGHSLVLAIDFDLQKAAEETFMDKAGAVIALDPNTGYVLALASLPGYDPNQLVGPNNAAIVDQLSKDSLKPWINKAIQDHFAPGSTFKAITAIAGLEHKVITTKFRRYCSGLYHLGKSTWRCFHREGDGWVNMMQALRSSCDVYFYNLGTELGPDRLADTARLFGFGDRSGIDLDKEIPGIMPDRAYYKKRVGYYAPGFVVNSAIGQGDVTVTPIQLAVAYAAILNGGTIFQPQLVREIIGVNGDTVERLEPKVKAHLTENLEELRQVKDSLAYIMKPGGTAYGIQFRQDLPELAKWLRESGVEIGGKTGTAQVKKLAKNIKHLDPDKVAYLERDHSWFVGFAPVEKPEILVVVMTLHGGFGASKSAPVAAAVIKTWFEKVRNNGRYAKFGVTHASGS